MDFETWKKNLGNMAKLVQTSLSLLFPNKLSTTADLFSSDLPYKEHNPLNININIYKQINKFNYFNVDTCERSYELRRAMPATCPILLAQIPTLTTLFLFSKRTTNLPKRLSILQWHYFQSNSIVITVIVNVPFYYPNQTLKKIEFGISSNNLHLLISK